MKGDAGCTLCSLHKTTSNVCILGSGPRQCDVMVIGEAPGQNEEDQGLPFVGRSGKLLRDTLEEHGLHTDDIFFTNAVSCRPPDNRTPTKREISVCNKWLKYQIAMVKPKFILLLGNVPMQSMLGHGAVKKHRGQAIETAEYILLPTYHPAYVLRDPRAEYAFKNDIRRFADIVKFGGIPYERAINIKIVDSQAMVDELLEALHGTVAYDLETTCLYPWDVDAKIVSIGFGTRDAQWVLPVSADAWTVPWSWSDILEIMELIAHRLDDCILVGHASKFDGLWTLVKMGIELTFDFDTMLAHYLLDENDAHALDHLAMMFHGAEQWDGPLTMKQGKSGKFIDHVRYLAQDVYHTRKLRWTLGKLLDTDEDIKRVFKKILMPCVKLFMHAEARGLYINTDKMKDAEEYLRDEMAKAEKELNKFTAAKKMESINWGSPQQVGDFLFGRLGIKCPQRTPTGAFSTSESTLNQIDHPCVAALLRYRGAKQQVSFFIEGWWPYLVNHRIHPSFKLHGTVTGRLSSEHPNAQQIPRDERIRSLISAPPGWTLVEADLSQIELRIAAELAQEQDMLRAFNTGVDIHWLTATREIARGGGMKKEVMFTATEYLKQQGKDAPTRYADAMNIVFKMGPDTAVSILKDWKELRKKAKAINFGFLFSMGWKKFKIYARDNYGVDVTDEQAKQSQEAFFELYPGLAVWHRRQRNFVRKHGYVRSLSGRMRHLPKAQMRATNQKEEGMKHEAERQSINSPVQSFANELNLMAALQLSREFPRSQMQIVATVHDAILFEIRDDMIPVIAPRILEVMSSPLLLKDFNIKLSVPIEADMKIGDWSQGVSYQKWSLKPIPAGSPLKRNRNVE